ncbi:MAG: hypothetical protein K2H40_16650, partial [Lachnospiraceae bacterium]|nr:hypothetical protein [Lachnospiraceae bacterium]
RGAYTVPLAARSRSAKNVTVLSSKAAERLFHQVPTFFKGRRRNYMMPCSLRLPKSFLKDFLLL